MTDKIFNPFCHRGLITDPSYFIGRKGIIRGITGAVLQGQSRSIVGDRKIGKSSLLYQMLHQDSLPRDKFIIIFFDSQRVASITKSEFWEMLLNELLERVKDNKIKEIILDDRELDLERARKVFRILKRKNIQLTFLFDEFECVLSNSFVDEAFLVNLRHLFGGEFKASLITTTKRDLFDLTSDKGLKKSSPFFNIFPEIRLGLFGKEEADELLNRLLEKGKSEGLTIEFDNQDREFIYDLAGYHPFFIQLVSYIVFERKLEKNKRLSKSDYAEIESDFFTNAESHFQYIWQSLKVKERDFLISLADKTEMEIVDNEYKDLKDRQLLVLKEGKYQIFSRGFEEFIKRQKPAGEAKKIDSIRLAKNYELKVEYDKDYLSVELRGGEILRRERGKYLHEDIQSFNVRIQEIENYNIWRRKGKYIGTALFREIVINVPMLAKSYWYARGLIGEDTGRLKILFIGDRDFIALPIEFLNAEESWLALKHPIVRSIRNIHRTKAPISPEFIRELKEERRPLKILLIASNTIPPIPGVNEEISRLEKLFKDIGKDKMAVEVKVIPTEKASLETIQNLLRGCKYHIVHYAGHGYYDEGTSEKSSLFFWEKENKEGTVKRIYASDIGKWLRKGETRFFYFSCCYGSTTGEEFQLRDGDFLGIIDSTIKAGVPSALGFRWAASDSGAIHLAEKFYQYLFDSFSLDKALFQARYELSEIDINDSSWASPILVVQE